MSQAPRSRKRKQSKERIGWGDMLDPYTCCSVLSLTVAMVAATLVALLAWALRTTRAR